MFEPDAIIKEIHETREKIVEECSARGISQTDYFREVEVPKGMKISDIKPPKIDFSKLESLGSSKET